MIEEVEGLFMHLNQRLTPPLFSPRRILPLLLTRFFQEFETLGKIRRFSQGIRPTGGLEIRQKVCAVGSFSLNEVNIVTGSKRLYNLN
jgi:hypothetical protein